MKVGNFKILKYNTRFQYTTECSFTKLFDVRTCSPALFSVLTNSLYRTTGHRSYIDKPCLPSGNCSVGYSV